MVCTRRRARLLAHGNSVGRPPASLLSLGEDLQVAILRRLSQQDLLITLPAVCKQLHVLLKRGSELWRRLSVDLRPGHATDENLVAMVQFFVQRHGSIQDLQLDFVNQWLPAVPMALMLSSPSLRSLCLQDTTHAYASESEDSLAPGYHVLLPPLQNAVHLTRLHLTLRFKHPSRLSLPDLSELTNMKQLCWQVCTPGQASHMPAGVECMTGLTQLRLLCKARSLPASYSRLQQLQELVVEFGSPAEAGETGSLAAVLPSLTALTSLGLLGAEAAALQVVPWARLSGLQQLDLAESKLEELPPGLVSLSQLQRLGLEGSRLWQPESLAELYMLGSLLSLSLSDCALTELPFSLSRLSRLENLYLSHNDDLFLTSEDVRFTLARLRNLRSLSLLNVPFSDVFPSDWEVLLRACPHCSLMDNSDYVDYVHDWRFI